MASAAPSSLFARLTNVWRHLALRSDVDDIILETLGRFSLDKIYAGPGDPHDYQQLVVALLVQLNAIFFLQRLSLPSVSVHAGQYLGLLASWEVTLRCVEFVLQALVEGRELLWEDKRLRDKYLADFLLSALRVLTLHPRPPANIKSRDKRERFARVHRLLEQVFDNYPGPKSFLLVVARDVTGALQSDPSVLDLPHRLKHELPNLMTDLYPLPDCMSSDYISQLVAEQGGSSTWLSQFLALRDIAKITVGASIQYSVNQETARFRNVHLQSSSARIRSAILKALDGFQMPSNLSQVELISHFSASFRIILPDTLDLSQVDGGESHIDEMEIDALDSFCRRLGHRQVIHRVSDLDTTRGISRVLGSISSLDTGDDHFPSTSPEIYVLNCPHAHIAGSGQLRASNIFLTSDPVDSSVARLSPSAQCIHCGVPVTKARELVLAKQTWQTLSPLRADADTVNVERHLPTQFQISPPRLDAQSPWGAAAPSHRGSDSDIQPSPFSRLELTSPTSPEYDRSNTQLPWPTSPLSPQFDSDMNRSDTLVRSDGSTYVGFKTESDQAIMGSSPKQITPLSAYNIAPTQDYITTRRGSPEPTDSALAPISPAEATSPRPLGPALSKSTPKKTKSKWKLAFGSTRKSSTAQSADSSSISSGALEAQKLEEISLAMLTSAQKTSSRSRGPKHVNVQISPSSSLAIFWTQLMIQVFDLGTSPPTLMKTIPTDSSCIVAAVARTHLAYVVGSRDQRLTLRIVNLARPSVPVVEHRMPSTVWCKSIAIDPKENYVVIGFETSVVRFFKTTSAEQFREDRLHGSLHSSCASCPPVDTLSFSRDGIALLASTRHQKNGLIQLYCWRFPFESFQELRKCWYQVPLHESEDNGISSAVLRTSDQGVDPLLCITTWTQSGVPLLIQPRDGHRSEIRTESGRQSKVGSRVQCAAFSASGRELALVNEKGNLFQITNLESSPLEIRRIATSKELTAKSESFAMNFVTIDGEESIIMAWVDANKSLAWVKKIPIANKSSASASEAPGVIRRGSKASISADIPEEALELPTHSPVELAASEPQKR